MKYSVTAIRDEVSKEYLTPSISLSDSRAVRDLESVVMTQTAKQEGMFFSHPSDFTLYKIGIFDSETSEVQSITPVLLRKVGEIV